jgi:hypothetical protein
MSDHAEIKELIQGLAKKSDGAEFQVQSGTVKSVDWDNRVCTVTTDEEYDVEGVRLRSLNDGNAYGCCYKPTVNSVVLIGVIYNKPLNAYVAMFSQVDAISWTDGNGKELFSADLTNGKFVFNGGNNKGIVKLVELVQKINQLENKYNELLNLLNGHVHVCAAPTVNSGPPVVPFTDIIAPVTQQNDLEDKNVTH